MSIESKPMVVIRTDVKGGEDLITSMDGTVPDDIKNLETDRGDLDKIKTPKK